MMKMEMIDNYLNEKINRKSKTKGIKKNTADIVWPQTFTLGRPEVSGNKIEKKCKWLFLIYF